MSLLGGLTDFLGLTDSSGRDLANEGRANVRKAQQTASDAFYELKQFVNNQRAAGAFNAQKELELANKQNQANAETTLKNMAAQSALVGYKPGDSKPTQGMNNYSQMNDLANQRQQLDIQNRYNLQDLQAQQLLNGGALNLAGLQNSGGQSQIQLGNQLQASQPGLGSLIGMAGQIGSMFGGSSGSQNLSTINNRTQPGIQEFDLSKFAQGLGNTRFR